MQKTAQEFAKEYFDLLSSPPNGWGQHVHPEHGPSRAMLQKGRQDFGETAFDAALDAEWKRRTEQAAQ